MKINISDMQELMEGILLKRGVSRKDAQTVVEDYIWGEKEGKKSHGLMAFPLLVERIARLERGKIVIERQGSSYALINGNKNFGQVVAKKAREIAIKKAKRTGVAVVGTYNMLPFLRPGTQAKLIGEEGKIGIVINNGGIGAIAPIGSTDPILATNPIGFSIPTRLISITADFSTAKRAWGEVKVAKAEGRKLPLSTFMDKEGNFTVDPNKAYSVAPFGDYKGYALALLVEILTGSLVNMPMGISPKDEKEGFRAGLRGALFMVIDPEKFTDFDKFVGENSNLVNRIKASRKAKNVHEILVPGERSNRNVKKVEKQERFEVDEGLYNKIKCLCHEC